MIITKDSSSMVNRTALAEFCDLKREIVAQARRIDRLEQQIKEHKQGIWLFGCHRRKRPEPVPDSVIQAKIGLEVSMILNLEMLEKRAAEIENAIQGLENPLYRELLRQRYIDGFDWNTIGDNINYVPRQCMRFHKAALDMFDHTQRVACSKT